MNNFKLFKLFTLIGLTTFGGGSSVVPILDKVLVKQYKVISEEKLLEAVTISNVLPGPSMIQMASSIGYSVNKFKGATVCAVAISTPSMILFTLIMVTISKYFNPEFIFELTLVIFVILGISLVETSIKISNVRKTFDFLNIIIPFILISNFNINTSLIIVVYIIIFCIRGRKYAV